jgi:peptidoglycan/LPS O-acetylase OafA/YrhL
MFSTLVIIYLTNMSVLFRKDDICRRRKIYISILLGFLESRPMVLLGNFSYSLYQIHSPVLNTVQLITNHDHMNVQLSLFVMTLIGLPISLVVAFLFYTLIELPSISLRPI